MPLSEAITLPACAFAAPSTGLRSPSATRCAAAPSSEGSAPSARDRLRTNNQVTSEPRAAMAPANAINNNPAFVDVALACSASFIATVCCNSIRSSTALNNTICRSRTPPISILPAASVSPLASRAIASSTPWL